MFISYFEAFKTRKEEAFDINFFYSQVYNIKNKDILYVTNSFYFKDVNYYRSNKPFFSKKRIKQTTDYYRYKYPTNEDILKLNKSIIDETMFDPLFEKYNNNYTEVEKYLLTEVFDPLYKYFNQLLENLHLQNQQIEAIFIIKNCPSIEKAAKKYNIPVIHYEIATFRNPMYKQTAYLDFKGVNGKTECLERFKIFKKELKTKKVQIFSKKQLLNILKIQKDKFKIKTFFKTLKTKKYKIGLAGQIFNDSNLIAFSEGFDNQKSLELLLQHFNKKDIIVRNHPGNPIEKKYKFENIDNSSSAYDFILRCKNIITINSSVGLESILLNKNAVILGDSPFKFLSKNINELDSNKPINDELLKLNFFIFGYLIPFEKLFDTEYIRWRLSYPTEEEIYNKNINFYMGKLTEKEQHD